MYVYIYISYLYVYIYRHTVYMHLSLSTSIHIHPQQHPAVGVHPKVAFADVLRWWWDMPEDLGVPGVPGGTCFRGGFNRPQDGEWDRMGHHGIYSPYVYIYILYTVYIYI